MTGYVGRNVFLDFQFSAKRIIDRIGTLHVASSSVAHTDDMFSVTINKTDDNPYGTTFTNLRYGTNVFHATIEFPTSYINDQYMVFFDSYDYG